MPNNHGDYSQERRPQNEIQSESERKIVSQKENTFEKYVNKIYNEFQSEGKKFMNHFQITATKNLRESETNAD